MDNYFVHQTSIVDTGAFIGKRTKIWHWSHISSKAKIGENCTIGQNVFIADNVTIGNNVKIQNNVSIYEGVTIEDDVFCGPSMVFTNVINPRSVVERKKEFKKTLVKRGATIGANSTIICGVQLGEFSFVGAGALITKNVKNFSLMVGVPAVQKGWMSKYGKKLNLPLTGNKEVKCQYTNQIYLLKESELIEI